MRFKTNLAVGLVFAALLAFVYFYEIRGGEKRAAEAARTKELLSFQDSAAHRLTIDRGDTVVVLEKVNAEWRLTQPVVDVADQQAVERYLNNLQESERERTVADSSAVVADGALFARFGLDAPRLTVHLELDEGPLDTLAFGHDTPTDRFAYVQQRGANPEVFVVRAWRFDNLDKGVFDLRDKRALPFSRDAVQALRLQYPDQVLALERVDSDSWMITEPLAARADAEAVRSLLSRLENGKAARFAAEAADDGRLEEYGLAPVRTLELSLLVGDERAEKRLWIGSEAPAGRFYARDMSAPQVFELDSLLVHDMSKTLDELRDRKLLRFDRQDVTRIQLERLGEPTIAVEQDTAGVWAVVLPDALAAKSWKVSSLLTDLSELEAESFADPSAPAYQTADARLTWVLSGTAGELARIRFSGAADQQVYAACHGDPAVYRLVATDFDRVDLVLEDLAEMPAPETLEVVSEADSASAHP